MAGHTGVSRGHSRVPRGFDRCVTIAAVNAIRDRVMAVAKRDGLWQGLLNVSNVSGPIDPPTNEANRRDQQDDSYNACASNGVKAAMKNLRHRNFLRPFNVTAQIA